VQERKTLDLPANSEMKLAENRKTRAALSAVMDIGHETVVEIHLRLDDRIRFPARSFPMHTV
jgi:hypothetical protein